MGKTIVCDGANSIRRVTWERQPCYSGPVFAQQDLTTSWWLQVGMSTILFLVRAAMVLEPNGRTPFMTHHHNIELFLHVFFGCVYCKFVGECIQRSRTFANCQDIEDSFKCPECGAPEFLVLKPTQPDWFLRWRSESEEYCAICRKMLNMTKDDERWNLKLLLQSFSGTQSSIIIIMFYFKGFWRTWGIPTN